MLTTLRESGAVLQVDLQVGVTGMLAGRNVPTNAAASQTRPEQP